MTEASENAYLVRVRAQVMCRDEGTGGWVALDGGGLADVMVGKRPRVHRHSGGDSNGDTTSSTSAPPHEYYIHGRRISDNMEVLKCTIKKDFQYNKVMPTFHHWVTDEKRFGLTFQTAADARAFDRGVRTAIEELLDGLGGAWPSLHTYKKNNPAPKEDDEEHNIFECLNLPSDSRSSSENSTASRTRRDPRDPLTQTPILSAITLPPATHHSEPLKQFDMCDDNIGEDSDSGPYLHLTPAHEYAYPQLGPGLILTESLKPSKNQLMTLKIGSNKLSSGSIKNYPCPPPPLPDKKPAPQTFRARLRCRYCDTWYLESANRTGACDNAPDRFRTCIEAVSCLQCAQCLVYHCMSEEDNGYASRPCACVPADRACVKRWLGLSLLSVMVPCLWCYWPLRCVQRAAAALGLSRAMHAPVNRPTPAQAPPSTTATTAT